MPKNASLKEIKEAYRKMVLEHHPDMHTGSKEKEKLFVDINRAYETLSDQEKRTAYDINGNVDKNFNYNSEEVLKKYKEQFYRENREIFLEQIEDSTRILYAGFDPQITINPKGTHISKSNVLPIVTAEKDGANAIVTSLGYNFYNYFIGIELRKEVPATLMYPISGLFGRYALFGHTDSKGAPPITNFEKEYHNRTPIKRFGIECGRPLEAALLIRYLNEVSKLPEKEIFDIVLDKTNYGKIDDIDFNAVDDETELVNILKLGFGRSTYSNFDVTNAPALFRKIHVDWFDHDNGGSSVRFELIDQPLPALTVPYNSIMISTTKEQQALGLSKEIYAKNMKYKEDYLKERRELSRRRIVADLYHRAEWRNMNWTINTPNGLDTALTAFMLIHVLVPTLEYFVPRKSLEALLKRH